MAGIDWSGWAQMAVAVGALTFAVREAREAREDRRAQSQREANDLRLRARPRLEGNYETDYGTGACRFEVKNVGLGPAILTKFQHDVNGRLLDVLPVDTVLELAREVGVLDLTGDRYPPRLLAGTVVQPGEVIQVMGFKQVRLPPGIDLDMFMRLFCARIDYESIYGEQMVFGPNGCGVDSLKRT
ncbi:hypothetical protein [Lysobacter sp. Root559]|uniref:hypothetical protein n=1 Tax=Lysobacter sp. Root559 TaxID=1736559 RepID=UPI0012F99E07|nr:hypothetical protein [Lysobacter sp. Root559]